jgi:hypothetical protein
MSIRNHLRSNVVGYVALFAFAIGGVAQALPGKNTVDSGDIKNGQVKTRDLNANAVKGSRVKDGTLSGADIGDGTLTGVEIGDGSLTPADIDTSLIQRRVSGTCATGSALSSIGADGTVGCASFSGAPDLSGYQTRIANPCPAGQAITAVAADGTATCGVTNGGLPGGAVPGGDLEGSYPSPTVKNNSLGILEAGADEDEIADDSIDPQDVADETLTGADIDNGSLGGSDVDESTLFFECRHMGGSYFFISALQLCMNDPGVADTWENAATDCGNDGMRLPTSVEAFHIMDDGAPTTLGETWTSGLFSTTSAFVITGTPTPTITNSAITNTEGYVCVSQHTDE